ncbi:hypothetical protein OFB92_37430, partial [Escherichia coli]|nr:hypothetical protein [Escherichia coli]
RAAGHAAREAGPHRRRTGAHTCASTAPCVLSISLTAPKRLALEMFRILLFTMSNTKVIRFGT